MGSINLNINFQKIVPSTITHLKEVTSICEGRFTIITCKGQY